MYACSATASSKPFGLFQDSADSTKVREATSQYKLRPRRKPRITQVPPLPSRGQGPSKAVVAETMPTSSADSSASVAHTNGESSGQGGYYRQKRSDFEEQAELVDVLNMLSQLYRDQAEAYYEHSEIVRSMGGLRAIEDQCRLYAMDDDNPLQTSVRKALLRLQMEMTLSEQASRQHFPMKHSAF